MRVDPVTVASAREITAVIDIDLDVHVGPRDVMVRMDQGQDNGEKWARTLRTDGTGRNRANGRTKKEECEEVTLKDGSR